MTVLVIVVTVLVTIFGVFPLSGWLIRTALCLLGISVASAGYVDYLLIGGALWLAHGLLTASVWYGKRRNTH